MFLTWAWVSWTGDQKVALLSGQSNIPHESHSKISKPPNILNQSMNAPVSFLPMNLEADDDFMDGWSTGLARTYPHLWCSYRTLPSISSHSTWNGSCTSPQIDWSAVMVTGLPLIAPSHLVTHVWHHIPGTVPQSSQQPLDHLPFPKLLSVKEPGEILLTTVLWALMECVLWWRPAYHSPVLERILTLSTFKS